MVESEVTWYGMDYSDFDAICDVCSIAFDVINVDAFVLDVEGCGTYCIYGIELVE